MPLLPVHEMEIDRATSRLELVRVNPTRQFINVPLDASGHWTGSPGLYTWQNGTWYDTGGNEIRDLDSIPQRFRDEIVANPVSAGLSTGPNVTKTCTFCGETMNASEWDGHMVEHVNSAMAQAGATKPPDKFSEPIEKRDTNQRRRE